MHPQAADFARNTSGSVADRMNQMGERFENNTPAQLAAVLHAVGAISYAERQNIEENGFMFQQDEPVVEPESPEEDTDGYRAGDAPWVDSNGYDAFGNYHSRVDFVNNRGE